MADVIELKVNGVVVYSTPGSGTSPPPIPPIPPTPPPSGELGSKDNPIVVTKLGLNNAYPIPSGVLTYYKIDTKVIKPIHGTSVVINAKPQFGGQMNGTYFTKNKTTGIVSPEQSWQTSSYQKAIVDTVANIDDTIYFISVESYDAKLWVTIS